MAVFKHEARKKRFSSNQTAWALLDGSFAKRVCTIVNISSTGAKLQCSEAESIPQIFQLAINDTRKVSCCKVVWRKGKLIGIQFVPGG
ncbi:MAG: PilZ domain-containing protein [Afipia sp.]|nr:PilZ domain-containing protein [Afipia sp.]